MNSEQLLAHIKRLGGSLSRGQMISLGGAFVAVVAVVVGSAYWISAPEYTLLVADMDAETASTVVAKLKADKVQYQLSDGGRTVRVPADRADELRLEFASGGLPSAGRIGFEIFDRPAFGTTEFLEHVNYRRALEGELARTIASLSEVQSARVHIAMAKDSLFADQEESAKASVVLRLKGNTPLSVNSVRGIQGLVSASVESLRPESVVILDSLGRQLTRPADAPEDSLNGVPLDRQIQLERDLTNRVVALLEPVVGPGRVRVNVAAWLRGDAVEETEERWDPATVVRSKMTTTETDSRSSAQGVAGARANQPEGLSTANTTPVAPPVVTGGGRMSETTNFEVSKLTRHRVSPRGQLARLSVAVLLDDERVTTKTPEGAVQTSTKTRDAAELQRIQGLVAAAVGLDTTRGDQLTVENISFEQPTEELPAPPAALWERVTDFSSQHWETLFRTTGIVVLATLAIFGVIRPMLKTTRPVAAPALAAASASAELPVTGSTARLPTIEELEGQIEAELDATTANVPRRLPVLSKRVAKLANDQPEQIARIMRGWLTEEER